MEAAGDAGAFQRLLLAVFFTDRHKTWHFRLGNVHFLPAPSREAQILDIEIGFGAEGVVAGAITAFSSEASRTEPHFSLCMS